MTRLWAFVAASAWFLVAFISTIIAAISIAVIVGFQFGITIGVLGALVPFLIGRGIIEKWAAAGVFGVIYSFGLLLYLLAEWGGVSAAVLALVGLAVVSGLASVEMTRSN